MLLPDSGQDFCDPLLFLSHLFQFLLCGDGLLLHVLLVLDLLHHGLLVPVVVGGQVCALSLRQENRTVLLLHVLFLVLHLDFFLELLLIFRSFPIDLPIHPIKMNFVTFYLHLSRSGSLRHVYFTFMAHILNIQTSTSREIKRLVFPNMALENVPDEVEKCAIGLDRGLGVFVGLAGHVLLNELAAR